MLGLGWMLCWGGAGRLPGRSSSLALARSCMPAAPLLVNVGEPGDAQKVAAWARACEGFFFFFAFPRRLWDLGSPIQDERLPRCNGSAESQPLDRRGILEGDFKGLNLVREIRRQGGARGQLCRLMLGGREALSRKQGLWSGGRGVGKRGAVIEGEEEGREKKHGQFRDWKLNRERE